ncbi:MAG: hypothetical protein P8P99_03165 [Maricaulis sp.]|nr:hypothetical protein [Maricaulis sp.]
MKRPTTIDELVQAFKKIDIPDPEGWANSELKEGINQLGRASVLKAIWAGIVDERDKDWSPAAYDTGNPNDMSASLKRILDAGVDPADLKMVVRGYQYQTAFDICYKLDDRGYDHDVNWRLFEVDEAGKPLAPIDGLHEDLLGTDPTGLEMGPWRGSDGADS